jgi:hypothetical protein
VWIFRGMDVYSQDGVLLGSVKRVSHTSVWILVKADPRTEREVSREVLQVKLLYEHTYCEVQMTSQEFFREQQSG